MSAAGARATPSDKFLKWLEQQYEEASRDFAADIQEGGIPSGAGRDHIDMLAGALRTLTYIPPASTPDGGDDQIKHMVNRFLMWKLPEGFNPDGGVSFKREFNEHTAHPMKHEPYGTNLLDYTQATAMVRHMLDGLPAAPAPVQAVAAYEAVEEKTESDNFHTSIYEADYKGLLVARCNQNGNHPQQVVAILQGLNGNAAPPAAEPVAVQVKALEFGHGKFCVDTGTYYDVPAVFISPAQIPGEVGTSSKREGHPLNALLPGDVVLTFPTDRQARLVADALVNALTHTDASAEIAALKEEVERLREAGERILPYLRWTISAESPGYHPTFPSAIGAFSAALQAKGGE